MKIAGRVTEVPVSRDNMEYIVAHLRARDRLEIYALRWDNDQAALVDTLVTQANPLWRVFCYRAVPAGLVAVMPSRPGVAVLGAFGTEHFSRVAPAILRYGKRRVIRYLREMCIHRAEAYALAEHEDGRRFIHALGGEPEAELHAFGRNREDFVLYAWRIDDVFQRWWGREQRHAIPVLHEQPRPDGHSRAGLAAGGDRPGLRYDG